MSAITAKTKTVDRLFDCKPAPLMEALEAVLSEKGLPYQRPDNDTFLLPDDGLTIQVKAKKQGQTAVRFTAVTTDNILLAHRLNEQLGNYFPDITPSLGQKRRRIFIMAAGCGTAVFFCLAALIFIGTRLYRSNEPPPLLWRHDAQGTVFSRPIIANDAIYFGTLGDEDSSFFALNLADGSERWQVSYGNANIPYWAELLTDNNLVLFGTDAGSFYALDADTGKEVWVFGPEQRGLDDSTCNRCLLKFRQPLLADGVVYLPSLDHHLYALDAKTGRELWRFRAAATFLDSPAVADNLVYAGSVDGTIYILDTETGQEQEHIVTDRAVHETLPDGSLVYAVLEGGELSAFDTGSGERVWQFNESANLGGFSSSMVVDDDKLFVMSSDRVYAVNKQSGELAWNFAEMQRGVYSDFTLEDGRFYVGDGESFLYILDANNGDLLHRFHMTLHDLTSRDFMADRLFTPAIHNGNAYFGWMGHLYAVDIQPED